MSDAKQIQGFVDRLPEKPFEFVAWLVLDRKAIPKVIRFALFLPLMIPAMLVAFVLILIWIPFGLWESLP
jgi:hypothetical protein